MESRDAAEALAEGQRAARSAARQGRATPQKLWPKANAQLESTPETHSKESGYGKEDESRPPSADGRRYRSTVPQ